MRNEWGPPSSNVAIAENEFLLYLLICVNPSRVNIKKSRNLLSMPYYMNTEKNIKNINKDEKKKLEQLTKSNRLSAKPSIFCCVYKFDH